ncbi:hypothetical protein BX600DRAFT_443410 [Xylariales sp. PMI_506]|nr:hypothetical protein BX600DRAFT_443410 [Xylariales sp. PMI_506]
MLADVIPRGKEFAFVALYALVNTSTAWTGPIISAVIIDPLIAVGMGLIACVDVEMGKKQCDAKSSLTYHNLQAKENYGDSIPRYRGVKPHDMKRMGYRPPLPVHAGEAQGMSKTFFSHTGPPELICQVLQACHSGPDVLALASTCRHVHDVWLQSAPIVIRKVWPQHVSAFEEALIAVGSYGKFKIISLLYRFVLHRSSLKHTDIQPIELGCTTRPPDIDEFKGILDLRQLAQAFEIADLGIKR